MIASKEKDVASRKATRLLPSPYEQLANCVWLPRILAKARLEVAGLLPPEYAERFGHPGGVDGQFLSYFRLNKEDIVRQCTGSDAEMADWFVALPSAQPGNIEDWNHLAINMGKSGFPMDDRLPIALSTTYRDLQDRGLKTVFEVLQADEQRG